MQTGKLSPDLLSRLLGQIRHDDPRVRIGPAAGEDAAVIALGDNLLIVTSDPITFAASRAGWHAVHVNANDIAAMGGDPLWFSATVLLPAATSEQEVEALFAQIEAACNEVGAALVTGHTEVTDSVTRPVVAGTMLGLASAGAVQSSGGAQPDDVLLVAGVAGVEGTLILAADFAADLVLKGLSREEIEQARALQLNGISVLPAARALRSVANVHALHDATEGGVATAALEIAQASRLALELDAGAVPLHPVSGRICAALELDPLGLVSSGCLLAALPAGEANSALRVLQGAGIAAAVAGRFTMGESVLLQAGKRLPYPEFARDELARYLDERRMVPEDPISSGAD
jgi:hydrogenase expression/formation protein HypE